LASKPRKATYKPRTTTTTLAQGKTIEPAVNGLQNRGGRRRGTKKETNEKGKIMNKTNSSLLESFIEMIESSKKDRERWLKKVGQCGLEQTLGEYHESQQMDQYRKSNS
jgi:hypothetical protein